MYQVCTHGVADPVTALMVHPNPPYPNSPYLPSPVHCNTDYDSGVYVTMGLGGLRTRFAHMVLRTQSLHSWYIPTPLTSLPRSTVTQTTTLMVTWTRDWEVASRARRRVTKLITLPLRQSERRRPKMANESPALSVPRIPLPAHILRSSWKSG